ETPAGSGGAADPTLFQAEPASVPDAMRPEVSPLRLREPAANWRNPHLTRRRHRLALLLDCQPEGVEDFLTGLIGNGQEHIDLGPTEFLGHAPGQLAVGGALHARRSGLQLVLQAALLRLHLRRIAELRSLVRGRGRPRDDEQVIDAGLL